MNIIRKERQRLRRAYFRKGPGLLRTREFTKAMLPLMPWFVAASVHAGLSVQLALLLPGILCTAAWAGFVIWTIEIAAARQGDRLYMQVGRHLLSKEYRS